MPACHASMHAAMPCHSMCSEEPKSQTGTESMFSIYQLLVKMREDDDGGEGGEGGSDETMGMEGGKCSAAAGSEHGNRLTPAQPATPVCRLSVQFKSIFPARASKSFKKSCRQVQVCVRGGVCPSSSSLPETETQ